MNANRALALFVVLFFATLAACKPEKEMVIGKESNGAQVEIKSGHTLVISLESNPTTGYSWGIAEVDDAILKSQGDPQFVSSRPGEKIVGAGGWETFRFDARKSGQTRLKLVYRRPWEKDVAPVQTFEALVTVP